MQEGLDAIDRWLPSEQPDQDWFRHFVGVQQHNIRRKKFKELVLFWISALLVISMLLVTLYRSPVVFLCLQFLMTCMLAIPVWLKSKGRRFWHER